MLLIPQLVNIPLFILVIWDSPLADIPTIRGSLSGSPNIFLFTFTLISLPTKLLFFKLNSALEKKILSEFGKPWLLIAKIFSPFSISFSIK